MSPRLIIAAVAAALVLGALLQPQPLLAGQANATTVTIWLTEEVHTTEWWEYITVTTISCSYRETYTEVYGLSPTWTQIAWPGGPPPGGSPPPSATPMPAAALNASGMPVPVEPPAAYNISAITALKWIPVHLGWRLVGAAGPYCTASTSVERIRVG